MPYLSAFSNGGGGFSKESQLMSGVCQTDSTTIGTGNQSAERSIGIAVAVIGGQNTKADLHLRTRCLKRSQVGACFPAGGEA